MQSHYSPSLVFDLQAVHLFKFLHSEQYRGQSKTNI